jgi:hypothetical protein
MLYISNFLAYPLRPMKALLLTALALATLVCVGCDKQQAVAAAAPAPKPEHRVIEHRFVAVGASDGGLALDTTTGLLCRTWAWRERTGDSDISTFTPLCYTLYRNDLPTGPPLDPWNVLSQKPGVDNPDHKAQNPTP